MNEDILEIAHRIDDASVHVCPHLPFIRALPLFLENGSLLGLPMVDQVCVSLSVFLFLSFESRFGLYFCVSLSFLLVFGVLQIWKFAQYFPVGIAQNRAWSRKIEHASSSFWSLNILEFCCRVTFLVDQWCGWQLSIDSSLPPSLHLWKIVAREGRLV